MIIEITWETLVSWQAVAVALIAVAATVWWWRQREPPQLDFEATLTEAQRARRAHQRDMTDFMMSVASRDHAVAGILRPLALKIICDYDPIDPEIESLRAFAPVVQNTQCLFAKNSKLWGSAPWVGPTLENMEQDGPAVSKANVMASIRAFTLFTTVLRGIDGFAFDIVGKEAGDTLEHFALTVRHLLCTLSDLDPAGYHCMRKSYVSKRGWVFNFAKEEFFITCFAPCYKETNSRFAFGMTNRAVVLFQPYSSFLIHNVGMDSGETEWDNPHSIRDRIRVNYRDNGRPYYIPPNPHVYPASHAIVPPMNLGEPVVEWWPKWVPPPKPAEAAATEAAASTSTSTPTPTSVASS